MFLFGQNTSNVVSEQKFSFNSHLAPIEAKLSQTSTRYCMHWYLHTDTGFKKKRFIFRKMWKKEKHSIGEPERNDLKKNKRKCISDEREKEWKILRILLKTEDQ